jgi:DNA helicase-2/ATP-dependent DNA helicase PcrA
LSAGAGGSPSDARSTLGEINALARRNVDLGTEGVTLATLHRSKGLEWDIVFVVGMADGCVRSSFATTPGQLAEEERLLHVGITRARKELHLTWPALNARGWDNRPSPYLDQLFGASTSSSSPPSRSPSRQTRTGGRSPGVVSRRATASMSSPAISSCAHCADPLKGVASRRLGVCGDCVRSAPGALGKVARQAIQLSVDAANATGNLPERLLSEDGLLRLLDKRPSSAEAVAATLGVALSGEWASRMAVVLEAS